MKKIIVSCLIPVLFSGCGGGRTARPPSPDYAYVPPPRSQPAYQPSPTSSYRDPYGSGSYTPPPAISQPEAKTIVSGKDFEVSEVAASMGKIDDIGLLFVRRPDGRVTLVQSAAWKYGLSGSASGSLNQYLESGNNLIIFALYNHKAKKLPFGKFTLDKWSYSLAIAGDGTTIWNDSRQGSQVENGVVSWSAFSVVKSGGKLVISRASDNQLSMLKPAFDKVNADFLKHPVSEDITDIANAVAVGIRTEVTGSN